MTSSASISSHEVAAESVGWLGQHVIGGDLGEWLAGVVEQPEHAAAGLDAHHRRQCHAPRTGPDQSHKLVWYHTIGPGPGRFRTPTGRPGGCAGGRVAAGPGQGQAYLLPGVRADGKFQVPARILPTGAPPQRDAGTDQPQIGGVVIDGVEELLALL